MPCCEYSEWNLARILGAVPNAGRNKYGVACFHSILFAPYDLYPLS